jgi:hypothetical protein
LGVEDSHAEQNGYLNPTRNGHMKQYASKMLIGGLIAGSSLMGVAYGATTLGTASAASSDTAATTTAPTPAPSFDPSKGGHMANGITETLLTGDDLTKATAAVNAAVPGATIQRVETDAEGAKYEAHIIKSDGTPATVKLDANFNVTGTETGGPGRRGVHGPNDETDNSSSSSSSGA